MKKLSAILLAFGLLVGTGISTAAVQTEKDNDNTSISKEIEALLKNHTVDLQEEIMADVLFMINTENEIVVLTVDTENTNVESFIKGRLNYERLKSSMVPGKEYKVPIRMQIQA